MQRYQVGSKHVAAILLGVMAKEFPDVHFELQNDTELIIHSEDPHKTVRFFAAGFEVGYSDALEVVKQHVLATQYALRKGE